MRRHPLAITSPRTLRGCIPCVGMFFGFFGGNLCSFLGGFGRSSVPRVLTAHHLVVGPNAGYRADTGERYLSTPLFEHVPADMTDEEREIAASTPSQPPPPPALPAVTDQGTQFVLATNAAHTVVIWSLEYVLFA